LWPFPDREIENIAERSRVILVPELNYGQMVLETERAVHGKARVVPYNLVNGELFKPEEILEKIEEVG
jgi:2-oxoglutarate ferredoxin oxidoreductase subunit alpha